MLAGGVAWKFSIAEGVAAWGYHTGRFAAAVSHSVKLRLDADNEMPTDAALLPEHLTVTPPRHS